MHSLDNVIWKALGSSQEHLGIATPLARRFEPEISMLGSTSEDSAQAMESLAAITGANPVGLRVEREPSPAPASWTVVSAAPLFQMLYRTEQSPDSVAGVPAFGAAPNGSAPRWIELTAADSPEMVALAELTRPGPFSRRTHEMGTYIGIRDAGRLVAMAGERLRIPGFTEISAVCTHPDFLGRGYAGTLMSELGRRILARRELPFLHVRCDNTRAIELYKRLGFAVRKQYWYAVLTPKL